MKWERFGNGSASVVLGEESASSCALVIEHENGDNENEEKFWDRREGGAFPTAGAG